MEQAADILDLVAGREMDPGRDRTRIRDRHDGPLYAALDLGTNNCRLLIARPHHGGFRVVDAFSRIVRLGEGLAGTGRLSEAAMERAVDALRICRDRMQARRVARMRLITTEACRQAENGAFFLERVWLETGLRLEVIERGHEAKLATAGCASLADPDAGAVVLFDIGGGSTEIVWFEPNGRGGGRHDRIAAWASLPVGVVTMAERYGGRDVSRAVFEKMVAECDGLLNTFAEAVKTMPRCSRFHLLGTSGTVTTLAGLHLGLPRYDRRRVDGIWMHSREIDSILALLLDKSYEERMDMGCIGQDRADLVLAGCAIFEAIRRRFPSERVRIADRGLREGMLMEMMLSDGVLSRSERHGR